MKTVKDLRVGDQVQHVGRACWVVEPLTGPSLVLEDEAGNRMTVPASPEDSVDSLRTQSWIDTNMWRT